MQRTLIKAFILMLMVCILSTFAGAAKLSVQDPIRLPDGQALKAVYLYPHWWEPWKSDDSALAGDLKKIKELGFNTICVDHESSQAVDNEWGWINREFKLARAENLYILPWLQLQGSDRKALIKFSHLKIKPAVNQDRQAEEDYITFRDKDFREALAHYVSVYLDQYGDDPALLKVQTGKRMRPVVGLIVEVGWHNGSGLPLSFDDESNAYFRTWMKSSHHDIKQLNKRWGTTYKSFDEIDPCDKTIFNYAVEDRTKIPPAVREHITFRARVINEALEYVARQVRKRHKDVLFIAETPYPFGSTSPDAAAYQLSAANERKAIEFADILFVRTLGDTVSGEAKKQQDQILDSYKQVITAYRLPDGATEKDAIALAIDGASAGNGIAYYNWNEHVDTVFAACNKPDKQQLLKTMNTVYDLICDPDKRHKTLLTTPAVNIEPVTSGKGKDGIPANIAPLPPLEQKSSESAAPVPPAPVTPEKIAAPSAAPTPVQSTPPAADSTSAPVNPTK